MVRGTLLLEGKRTRHSEGFFLGRILKGWGLPHSFWSILLEGRELESKAEVRWEGEKIRRPHVEHCTYGVFPQPDIWGVHV